MNTVVVVQKILLQIDEYVNKRRARIIDLFRAVDSGGDGTVTPEELREGLEKIGITASDDEFLALTHAFDPDGSGEIEFSEFVQAVKTARNQTEVIGSKEEGPNIVEPILGLEDYGVADVFELLQRVQKQSLFFRGFTDSDLQAMAKSSVGVVEFSEGQVLVPGGKRAEWFGVLVSGCLSMQTPFEGALDDQGKRSAVFGPGDWVNETDFIGLLSVDGFCKEFVASDPLAGEASKSAARMWNRGRQAADQIQQPAYRNLALMGDFDDVLQVRNGAVICWNKETIDNLATVRTPLCLKLLRSLIASSRGVRPVGSGPLLCNNKESQEELGLLATPEPSVTPERSKSRSGRTNPTRPHTEVIRKLKTALEQEKDKWKRKFEVLKGVLEDQHKERLNLIVKKHKADFHQQLQETHAAHKEEIMTHKGAVSDMGKKDDRERLALRAKVARLTKELKELRHQQEEKEKEIVLNAKSTVAKTHWGSLRSDMKKSAQVRDRFAELMRQGTLKALRNVREEAVKALEDTREKLTKTAAEAQTTEEALANAEALKTQMSVQIETLQDLVARTEKEKSKLDDKANDMTRSNIRRRFAAAKAQAGKRRAAEALQSARDEARKLSAELQLVTEDLAIKQSESAALHQDAETLRTKVEQLRAQGAKQRGWTMVHAVCSHLLISVLRIELKRTKSRAERQEGNLAEMERTIGNLRQEHGDLQERHEGHVSVHENVKEELGAIKDSALQLRAQKESAQKLMASLSSHVNTLQKSLTTVKKGEEAERAPRTNRFRRRRPSPAPAKNKNKTNRKHSLDRSLPISAFTGHLHERWDMNISMSAGASHGGTKSPRPRWLRKTGLLFINIDPFKSANLTGWALSNKYTVLTPRGRLVVEDKKDAIPLPSDLFGPGGAGSVSTLPDDILEGLRAIIWRPPRFKRGSEVVKDGHYDEMKALGECLHSQRDLALHATALEAEYEGLRSAQLQRALGIFGYSDERAEDHSLRMSPRPLVVVVHDPDDLLWGRSGVARKGVVILPDPLTAAVLSSALSVSPSAVGESSEALFSPQRPVGDSQRKETRVSSKKKMGARFFNV